VGYHELQGFHWASHLIKHEGAPVPKYHEGIRAQRCKTPCILDFGTRWRSSLSQTGLDVASKRTKPVPSRK
jgi:hypothetical protein